MPQTTQQRSYFGEAWRAGVTSGDRRGVRKLVPALAVDAANDSSVPLNDSVQQARGELKRDSAYLGCKAYRLQAESFQ